MKPTLLLIVSLSFMLGWLFSDSRTELARRSLGEGGTIVRKNKANSLLPPRLYRIKEWSI